ncbi:MAG: 5'/3'-nucleotidase SurE [Planctomycetota bacterium]|nr:5'/3'-nucleotidase SurE [Planctomycetota bacterium]
MRILVTNDDGILAPGILALRRAVADMGEVTVVAPVTPQSAVGHSITLNDPIRVHRVPLGDGVTGCGVQGRPADCVKLAILELMPERPDLVVSGVNLGANTGINVLYSGTVAAAVEGAFFGVPAVAVSIEDSDAADFDGAARITRRIIDQFLAHGPRDSVLLNVNVPDLAKGPPKGVKICPQSMKGWREGWEKRSDPRGRTYYWMIGNLEPEAVGVDSDVAALADRYVTVTPLRFDLTDQARMSEVRGWDLML